MSLNQPLNKLFNLGRKKKGKKGEGPSSVTPSPPPSGSGSSSALDSSSAIQTGGSSEHSSYYECEFGHLDEPESGDRMDTSDQGDSSSAQAGPDQRFIDRLNARGIRKFRVIDHPPMDQLGITQQFHTLIDVIGIRSFLYSVRDSQAYRIPVITFIATFWYEDDRVAFQLLDQPFEMSLDQFSDVLDVPRGGRREPPRLIYKTWIRITKRIHTRDRKGNHICHLLLRYIHRALSNSVFARGETMASVQRSEIFFLQCMLILIPVFSLVLKLRSIGYQTWNGIRCSSSSSSAILSISLSSSSLSYVILFLSLLFFEERYREKRRAGSCFSSKKSSGYISIKLTLI